MNCSNSSFESCFGRKPQYLFSAPGRTELSGNHTDHQHGCVLAAAVDLETLAWVAENDLGVIRVCSQGYPPCEICLRELEKKPEEENTTAALIRGVAAKFASLGAKLSGFDAYCTSTVLPGSGLSSSAAFEVLIGTILNHLFFEAKCTPVEIAQIGQWAENVYFGKPCGLMDQTASAVGGIVGIDFLDPAHPRVEHLDYDFSRCGYTVCIIDSGADHTDLTGEYAAITAEMKAVASMLGVEYLRDADEEEFYRSYARIRQSCGDRAVLRAVHFFEENRRVQKQLDSLRRNDFDAFVRYAAESGRSSWTLLQNVTPTGGTVHQDVAAALTLAEHLLAGRGAARIHGGGFAGTILAFVPNDLLASFRSGMDQALGDGHCQPLHIRAEGGVLVKEFSE